MTGSTRWLLVLAAIAACGGRTDGRIEEPADAGVDADADAGDPVLHESDQLDILLVVDNSDTAFFQQALGTTIPYLLDRLVAPRCVNGLGQVVDDTPMGAPCAVGIREFAAVTDFQVAVISSSLGSLGADTCTSDTTLHGDDAGRLLTRTSAGGVVPSYGGDGFLAWDPLEERQPPGDSDLAGMQAKLQSILEGVGRSGCGFEQPLESMYRFLVEPDPYERIQVSGGQATAFGVDPVLLEQRAAFLRPDSTLLVVLLSDEDDCSTRVGGTSYQALQASVGQVPFRMPRARSECALDPEDACCTSCSAPTPPGCPELDPSCALAPYDEFEDPLALRCFDQKRRFGVELLYPIERYVEALSEPTISDRLGNVVPNPLFAGRRSKDMIVLAGVVGVPWQDIALASTGIAAGFVPSHQIAWDRILSDPESGALPDDPLMIPSREPRSGVNPVTGEELAPPEAPTPENDINGHEHSQLDELQYACIYELAEQVDCGSDPTCPCGVTTDNNPVCHHPGGLYTTVQRAGFATPATRPLRVLRELGPRAVVASICSAPIFAPGDPGFGYRPAVDAMLRAVRTRLVGPDEGEE
jgi:hypothetical protein